METLLDSHLDDLICRMGSGAINVWGPKEIVSEDQDSGMGPPTHGF
jgi:hypothetical protein